MKRHLMTGNAAAAWGARLAGAEYLPAFPITPQTEIIETISRWIGDDEMDCRMVMMDSEHSMITAAGAAAATGVRVFTATSSQGLLYGMEMLYTVAGWRAPFVMANVSRGLSAPITLESDHNDIFAARDSGFLQIHCATCQEILDTMLIAYRLAENRRVRLPVIVNFDGYYLSFTREPVEQPDQAAVDAYLPAFDPGVTQFRAGRPVSQAVAVLGGGPYSYFRYQIDLGARAALEVYDEAAEAFAERFGRNHGALDAYRIDDAEIVFYMVGSFATKAKDAVDRLRETGANVGLLRLRLVRPFPEVALQRALAGKKGVAVIDQNLSPGKGGVLHTELLSALYGRKNMPAVITSFIGGLGGRDISAEEFFEIAAVTAKATETGDVPPPRLLYTEGELREMRKLQAIAHVEQHEEVTP
ncbi:MAG: pyruvate synthase [Rhodospirillaceae bacterium]|jgi:pyruvate ferredoxin oxidoreductase alpha subunit|nr:pyruvate synthase [Rhodospirillaceae bacterium]MBT5812605.1 pyruvate synthase [Rhodospirillaceae bacterium]